MAESVERAAVKELTEQAEQRAARLARRLAVVELESQLAEIRYQAEINKIRIAAQKAEDQVVELAKMRVETELANRLVAEDNKLVDKSDAKDSRRHADEMTDDRAAVELTEIHAALQLTETRTAAEQAKLKAIELIKMNVKAEPVELLVTDQPTTVKPVAELAKIREAAKQAEQQALELTEELAANQLQQRLAQQRMEAELTEICNATQEANKQVAELNKMHARVELAKRPDAELNEIRNKLEQAKKRAANLVNLEVITKRHVQVMNELGADARSNMDEKVFGKLKT